MELDSRTIGLIAGVVVFCATVFTTFLLLVFGGSFKRMQEEVCCISQVSYKYKRLVRYPLFSAIASMRSLFDVKSTSRSETQGEFKPKVSDALV